MIRDQDFWDCGYAIVENCLDTEALAFVAAAMAASAGKGSMKPHAGMHSNALDEYGPVAGEVLLRHCRPAFEQIVGEPLIESYAFWRTYYNGAVLKPHMDRIGCEISATIAIRSDPVDMVWPIMVEDLEGKTRSIELSPGNALLYQGNRVKHWRDPFAGKQQMQMFFHYVCKEGAYAGRIFDGKAHDPLRRKAVP